MLRIYDFNYGIKTEGLGFEKAMVIKNEIITDSAKELRKQVRKNKEEFTVLTTNSYEVKREAVDNALVDVIAHNENAGGKSKKKYWNSGVDQVIARKCAENKISVMICFRDFLKTEDRGLALGMMRQNVKICLKYRAPIIIASGAKSKDELVPADNLIAFAEFLGMNRKQARESVSLVAEKILGRKK